MKLNIDLLDRYGPFKANLCLNALVQCDGEILEMVVYADTRKGVASQFAKDRNGSFITYRKVAFDAHAAGHTYSGPVDVDLDDLVTLERRGQIAIKHQITGKTWGPWE